MSIKIKKDEERLIAKASYGNQSVEISIPELRPDMRDLSALYGVVVRMQRCLAQPKDKRDPDKAWQRLKDIVESMKKGSWTSTRRQYLVEIKELAQKAKAGDEEALRQLIEKL